jgi:hypothetical protein
MKHDEDIFEVELSSRDLLAITQPRAPDKPRVPSRVAYGLGAAAVVAVAAVLIASRASRIEDPAAVAVVTTPPAVAVLPPAPEPPAPPVKFTNPFDRTEVFEFPAGTSRAQARQKVAEVLIKRAQERRPTLRRVASKRTGERPV